MHPFPGASSHLLIFIIQLIQHLLQRSILCIRQSIQLSEIMFDILRILIKAQYVTCCYLIYDFRWSKSVHLLFKDVFQTFLIVWELLFHLIALVQTLHNFGNIQTRFYIQINKCLIRHIKTARILLLQHVHHFLDHCLWCKYLIDFLRWNIIKYILYTLFIKIIGNLFL